MGGGTQRAANGQMPPHVFRSGAKALARVEGVARGSSLTLQLHVQSKFVVWLRTRHFFALRAISFSPYLIVTAFSATGVGTVVITDLAYYNNRHAVFFKLLVFKGLEILNR